MTSSSCPESPATSSQPTSISVPAFTREISLNIPLVSAAMDTVTEHEAAICMAQNGGIGIVHKNLSVPSQAA